jgi:hypothetical protein
MQAVIFLLFSYWLIFCLADFVVFLGNGEIKCTENLLLYRITNLVLFVYSNYELVNGITVACSSVIPEHYRHFCSCFTTIILRLFTGR